MPTGHYERIQDPLSSPSPIARIEVLNPNSSEKRVENVKAILDTGVGITVIPESIIEILGALDYTVIRIRSTLDTNDISSRKLYRVIIEFDGQENEVKVLAIPRDYAIIGRDILNKYKITLNGPEETWSIEYSRFKKV
jgi:predicted aspartyl protease